VAAGCASSAGEQLISGPTQIGPIWKEFVPAEPLRVIESQQEVFLGVNGVVDWDLLDSRFVLSDGSSGRVDAWIHDDQGGEYELSLAGIGGRGGLYLTRKAILDPMRDRPRNGPVFPADRVYTRLRIRSDLPLDVHEILWVTHSNT
jgi:hypothetical protein